MKKTILIILFSLFSLFFYTQNIKVVYAKGYKNYKNITNEKPKIFKGLNYELIISNNEATFSYIDNLSINESNKKFIGRGGGDGLYYKNSFTKEKLHQVISPITNKLYLIYSKTNEIKWTLTNESKKINGYSCYKAIGNKSFINPLNEKKMSVKIIAWYTPEINVSFGPSGYDGLPGLVLETKTGSFYFIAEKIIFNENNIIKKPTKGEKISQNDYDLKLKQEMMHIKM